MLSVGIFILSILTSSECLNEKNNLIFSSRDSKGWGSESSFFDIALTALAFLSFGIFLLNLLCNALLYPSMMAAAGATGAGTNPGPILTMVGGGNTGGAVVTGGRRQRRGLFTPEQDQLTSAKFLITFVTTSIEKMIEKHECLPRLLCEGNRKSRVLHSSIRTIIPATSFIITYLGNQLHLHNQLPIHLKAISTGLKEENCQVFQTKC